MPTEMGGEGCGSVALETAGKGTTDEDLSRHGLHGNRTNWREQEGHAKAGIWRWAAAHQHLSLCPSSHAVPEYTRGTVCAPTHAVLLLSCVGSCGRGSGECSATDSSSSSVFKGPDDNLHSASQARLFRIIQMAAT